MARYVHGDCDRGGSRYERQSEITPAVWFRHLTLLISWPAPARGQSQDVPEGAKKEGQLVFYAGIPVPDAQAILSALERKYPFIKTTFYRATGSALVSRIQTEQRAKTHTWDVMNATGFEPYVLVEQGYFAKYDAPEQKAFPEGHKDNEELLDHHVHVSHGRDL